MSDVLLARQPFDQAWSELVTRPAGAALEARDRALARLIAATVLRRQGELEHVLNAFIEKPLPADKGRLWPILLSRRGTARVASACRRTRWSTSPSS